VQLWTEQGEEDDEDEVAVDEKSELQVQDKGPWMSRIVVSGEIIGEQDSGGVTAHGVEGSSVVDCWLDSDAHRVKCC
jgi:hypothetical protein